MPTLDPGRPGLRALIVVGVAAALVAAFIAWRSQPSPEPLPAPSPLTTTTPGPPPSPSATAKVTVHVAGKVRKPGVYSLPAGSRVMDALTAAGGAGHGASTNSINLARRLVDGEQVVIGIPASAPAVAGLPSPESAILDLNAATPDQLEQLPGVGEVLAARIVDFRTAHGGFASIEQLREVSGIGPRKYDEIKTKVRV
ncbi:ComEA family DNA-binding protein [Nonomuraea sp. NPDC005983]|uniref:ComEA family DNA-binding protein n=1 Tax=Nonomuraea sp. NPDC005983 TaxID=3155595 RepID=UPI0033A25A1F